MIHDADRSIDRSIGSFTLQKEGRKENGHRRAANSIRGWNWDSCNAVSLQRPEGTGLACTRIFGTLEALQRIRRIFEFAIDFSDWI
jgi:hypothetical protein